MGTVELGTGVDCGGGSGRRLCVLCQSQKPEKTISAQQTGWSTIHKAAEARKELLDNDNAIVIERILSLPNNNYECVYHKSCYDKFTNKTKLDRLRKNVAKTTSGDVPPKPVRTLRSSVGTPFNKALCIICQADKDEHNLRNATTFIVSNKLNAMACFDYLLKTRMTYAFDAMAGDMRYHTYCLHNKERELERKRKDSTDSNVSLLQLCFELHTAAAKGQVLSLEAVFERYIKLAHDVRESVPKSYMSRRSTFREKLESQLSNVFYFYRPLDRDVTERGTLLISQKFKSKAADMVYEDEESPFPTYSAQTDSGFNEIVHVALKLKQDLKEAAAAREKEELLISEDTAASKIPESVFLFLSLLFGGQNDQEIVEEILDGNAKAITSNQKTRILSLAQDWLYIASKDRALTPKHVGLALTLHQKTRSRELVTLFHKAGHCASYEQVLKVDTRMSEKSLRSMDPATGAVVPDNFRPISTESDPPVLHVTADNIDIQMDTLDGKRSFHGTQMVAFRRGLNSQDDVTCSVDIAKLKDKSLKIPEAIHQLVESAVVLGKNEPVFRAPVERSWYTVDAPPIGAQEAEAMDGAFLLLRTKNPGSTGWTEFNKSNSTKNPAICNVGYMPIILNPAHEKSTLNTVLERSLYIADQLRHDFVVVTVDQQLYCQMLELKWATDKFRSRIVLRMGGLHIALNYLRAIGQHTSNSGLMETWVESGIVSEGSARKVVEGKAYNKAMRLHKLSLQALWMILEPHFFDFLAEENVEVLGNIEGARCSLDSLLQVLRQQSILQLFSNFIEAQRDVNLEFWWSYMKMVFILLQFTRSIREGIWDLYLFSLSEMIPMMARYDHHNYLKSLTVYIAEMHQLPAPIEEAFKNGEFVVKRSAGRFNQVDPDHAQEWIVGEGKASGGIVGLIQQESALDRWAISYNWRSEVSRKTRLMFDVKSGQSNHSELDPARRDRDKSDEDCLTRTFVRFGIFDSKYKDVLRNIATKDVASPAIQESLLAAEKLGREQVLAFVDERLTGERSVSYHSSVSLNHPLTFDSLYKMPTQKKQTAERRKKKEDRDVLHRLIMTYEAGRSVDLADVLKHELLDVPPALAEPDGSLRSGAKSDIVKLMTKNLSCPPVLALEKSTAHLVIDGQALVQAIGLPPKAKTFFDLFLTFRERVKALGARFIRVDLVFDRYDRVSLKSGTREKRAKKARPIRKHIDSRNVPLPKNWNNFISLPENKAELACFLSNEILANPIEGIELVVAGGFEDAAKVASTQSSTPVDVLKATHEEADTRVVLHAVHSPYQVVVVFARDTDVFLLLVHHFSLMKSDQCWMMSGTSKDRFHVPIHEVCRTLPKNSVENALAFHAVTGCDTTSFLATIGKRGAYKVFEAHSHLLSGFGDHPLPPRSLQNAEEFVVRLYGVEKSTADEARLSLFGSGKRSEALPPTSDALQCHLLRANYQTLIWRKAVEREPHLPPATDYGWKEGDDGRLLPILRRLDPVPKACSDLISCGCKTGCATRMCKCRRTHGLDGSSLFCTNLCRCKGDCTNGKEGVDRCEEGFTSDDDL